MLSRVFREFIIYEDRQDRVFHLVHKEQKAKILPWHILQGLASQIVSDTLYMCVETYQ